MSRFLYRPDQPATALPSVEAVAGVVRPILVRVFEQDKDIVAEDVARAVLALFPGRTEAGIKAGALEAAEAEIERLRCVVEAEDLHAALAPGETCGVCVHLEAENLAEHVMAEMDRADAAEAKLAAVMSVVNKYADHDFPNCSCIAHRIFRAMDGRLPRAFRPTDGEQS